MFTQAIGTGSFAVDIATSDNGGHPPEFWAKRAIDRIISIADSTDPAISDQARIFRDQIEQIILYNINQAISCDRGTVGYMLTEAGYPQLAEAIRRP